MLLQVSLMSTLLTSTVCSWARKIMYDCYLTVTIAASLHAIIVLVSRPSYTLEHSINGKRYVYSSLLWGWINFEFEFEFGLHGFRCAL